MTTVFKKIIEGEIPCEKVFENDRILAFKDIAPKAPVHLLIIPKKEIPNLQAVGPEDYPPHWRNSRSSATTCQRIWSRKRIPFHDK